jgi:DNA-binding response OmpR family regulator
MGTVTVHIRRLREIERDRPTRIVPADDQGVGYKLKRPHH